ncbi:MAG TPA: hypothetical protein VFI25_15660 [Planctomycetota bacterium]|jgi:hypothetical protein|nr:hypothetical protein [Planctomycetota bacterium]
MLTIVADLLVTDTFLIKGRVEGKYARLSKVLDDAHRCFLAVREATLIDLQTRERVLTPRVHVNLDEVVLAHELVDAGGDLFQAALARERESVRIRAFHAGRSNLEIAGRVRPNAYEPSDGARRFFVVEAPEIRGIRLEGDKDLEILRGLPYVIVNRERLSYIYDFDVGFASDESE